MQLKRGYQYIFPSKQMKYIHQAEYTTENTFIWFNFRVRNFLEKRKKDEIYSLRRFNKCISYITVSLFFITSPELKANVNFSDHLSSVRMSVCKLHIFIIFSRTTGPISTKLGTKHPLVKGISVFQRKDHALFQGR